MTRLTDKSLEIAIGRMLQAGVLLAGLVVLAGGVLYLLHATGPRPIQPLPWRGGHLRTPSGIWHGTLTAMRKA